jgi:hypothetical protein
VDILQVSANHPQKFAHYEQLTAENGLMPIQRLGGNERITLNTRVLAASHKDPTGGIGDGALRREFFFRFQVIEVPPLHERRDGAQSLGSASPCSNAILFKLKNSPTSWYFLTNQNHYVKLNLFLFLGNILPES